MVKVTVRLFATFRDGREKVQVMELQEGITPLEIIKKLGILASEIAILLVNGRDGKLENALADGDILSLFPPVGGG